MPRRLASLLLPSVLLLAPALLQAEALNSSVIHTDVINRIVLRVNDRIATFYDYQQRKAELVRDIVRREQDQEERQRQLGQAGEVVFADLFRELLLDSRADQLAIEITDAQVDQSMAQLKQNFNIKTDQDFAAALAQSGMTEPQLRAQVKGNLRMQEVRGREVQSRVKVDEEDLRRYYRKNLEQFRQPEQVQLREVVVLEEGGSTADQRKAVAGEIRGKVKGGASLADAVADLAKKNTTSNVIELGWVSPGDLDKNLEGAVWKLPVGSLSDPVEARGGLHLVQVIDRRESRIPPFNEVSSVIQTREQERVYRDEVAKYMVELEKKSLVVANPPQEAAGFRSRLGAAPESTDPSDIGAAAATPPAPPAVPPAADPGKTIPGTPKDKSATPQSPATNPPAGTASPGSLPAPPDPSAPPPPGA
ncbi:MAG TPA: peptidyl-prolyl cis-trans isomerase [Thermoanaerobaculia bacterium]|nr:peptidyl-prolyl cis-trans isomerase [Thermoanaerobaculia bacterium]